MRSIKATTKNAHHSRRKGSARQRYMIRCDMEGVSGVVSCEQTDPGAAEYGFGLRMFQADLNACLEGLFAGGSDEVVVYDEHYYGRNVDHAHLSGRVSVICGKPPYTEEWAGGLDATFAGMVLLGFHSMAGTPGGLLRHSYEPDIAGLRLNGVVVGEIGMETAIAGDFGVPVVLVSADSAGTAEAEQAFPGVVTVAVKESLHPEGGRCFPLSETTQAIRLAAEGVVRNPPKVRPWRLEPPVTLEVELNDGAYLNAVKRLHSKRMKGGRTVLINGNNATSVWAEYWRLKLECQAAAVQRSAT